MPPFPGDCCPAENGVAAGLGRKPVTCCLAGYCFVPVFKADILHQVTVLTLLLLSACESRKQMKQNLLHLGAGAGGSV